jgi:GR25 family glycosyltransferase involved in LPS biosynthesis
MQSIIDKCAFYCVSYNSPERKRTMTERFETLGLYLNVHTGVQMDDPRLQFSNDPANKRLASCFYGHMDNIRSFYDTGKPYGFFCEDDVMIHRDFANMLPTTIQEFEGMGLDVLLLGYMTEYAIAWWMEDYYLVYDHGPESPITYRYHRYPERQWGVHLYIISRDYAARLLQTYDDTYAARQHVAPDLLVPYNPDWTISKLADPHRRAIRYPMLAVEDGKGVYEDYYQGEFHENSHRVNYIEGEFL